VKNAHEALNQLSQQGAARSSEKECLPQAWVEAIFMRLSAQLGAKVADLWGGVPPAAVKAEWAQGLAGFSPSEIKRGLSSCQTRAFVPTLGEFVRLCRPAIDPEYAWVEAQAGMKQRTEGQVGDWSHPAVFRAARDFEQQLRSGTYRQFRREWERRLELEFKLGWGDDVPRPNAQLADQATTRSPNSNERMRLAELRAAFAGSVFRQATGR
jgi:hypothetical protein